MRKLGVDSFGVDIIEGDTIECFDYYFCNCGSYKESIGKFLYNPFEALNYKDYEERAIKNGYTVKRESGMYYKPIVGVVEFDDEWLTYRPLVNFGSEDDLMVSCLSVMKKYGIGEGSYIKVIKKATE